MSARKDLAFAAIEAFGALMLTVLLSSWATSTVLPALGLPKSLNGPLNVLVTIGLLAVGYSSRFRHHQPFLKGALPSSVKDVISSCIPRAAGSTPSFVLLSMHGLQLAAIYWLWQQRKGAFSKGDGDHLLQCADASGLLWSPLFEEVFARFLLFYIAFQRSRGNLLFSVTVGAFIFALLHFANAYGSEGGIDVILCLQALLALVAGATYGCVYAASGSLFWVTVVHAANNAVAYAWMLLNDTADNNSGVQCGSKPAYTTSLLVFLCVTVVAYSAVAASVYRGLAASIQTEQGAARFKSLHPLVYDAERSNGNNSNSAGEAIADAPAARAIEDSKDSKSKAAAKKNK